MANNEVLEASHATRDWDPNHWHSSDPPQSKISNDVEYAETLFHVKAKHCYTAQNDDQFTFQAGDIIAVTAAAEADRWWSGMLLDETRRHKWWREIPLADVDKLPGLGMFPSDMVTLV